jgi:hypothetical protein
MVRCAILAFALAACGRVGFEAAECPPFAEFCDDFESGDLTKWSWTGVAPGATVVATETHAHSGKWGMLVAAPPTTDGGATAGFEYAATSTGTVAIREWVYSPVTFDVSIASRTCKTLWPSTSASA